MSDIFKEVDDALKKEKAEEFWKKNGNMIIFLIILAIAGTGFYSVYQNWKQSQKSSQTAILVEMMKSPQDFDSSKLQTLNPDPHLVGLMMQARIHLTDADYPSAFQAFQEATSMAGADKNMRGLAAYYARNMILNAQVDGALEDIQRPEGTIWQAHYDLQDAINLGSNQKDFAAANEILDRIIADTTTDPALRSQADRLKYIYEYDFQKMSAEKDQE